ncbi:MAG: DinB family protein [Ignavibacteria bacterium]|nr:DinB family protein [Ignavibacteria bacterium]
MTLQELKSLHAYSSWADNRIFDSLEALPSEQYLRNLGSSHGGIHGTMIHLVGAQKIWLERFKGETGPFLATDPPESLAALKRVWEKVGYDTAKWLGMLNDSKLNGTFSMKNLKGETLTQIFWQAFQHLANHSSYHRGQVVTMMRQLGAQPPTTDMILFYMESRK